MEYTVHIPLHLNGCTYYGSKKIDLDSITISDARLILKESPNYGILITEVPEIKKTKKK